MRRSAQKTADALQTSPDGLVARAEPVASWQVPDDPPEVERTARELALLVVFNGPDSGTGSG